MAVSGKLLRTYICVLLWIMIHAFLQGLQEPGLIVCNGTLQRIWTGTAVLTTLQRLRWRNCSTSTQGHRQRVRAWVKKFCPSSKYTVVPSQHTDWVDKVAADSVILKMAAGRKYRKNGITLSNYIRYCRERKKKQFNTDGPWPPSGQQDPSNLYPLPTSPTPTPTHGIQLPTCI